MAGSLQVHKRAKLVGTVTFGKGSVQQDFPLADGADIHLTIKRWYLPNGTTIDHKGLTPDLPVTLASSNDEFDVSAAAVWDTRRTPSSTRRSACCRLARLGTSPRAVSSVG